MKDYGFAVKSVSSNPGVQAFEIRDDSYLFHIEFLRPHNKMSGRVVRHLCHTGAHVT